MATRVFHKWYSLSVNHDKTRNDIVARGVTQLATDTLPFVVIECAFPLLPLVRYPLWLTAVNRYHPRHSNGNIFFTTTPRNVSVVTYGVSLVTILLLDFVLIHWIQWKSFMKNSTVPFYGIGPVPRQGSVSMYVKEPLVLYSIIQDFELILWCEFENTVRNLDGRFSI